MKRLPLHSAFALLDTGISYGIFSDLGWDSVQRFDWLVSLAVMAQLYVWRDVLQDVPAGIRNPRNTVLFLLSIALLFGSVLLL